MWCEGPALVRIESQPEATNPSSRKRILFLVVFGERGWIGAAESRLLAPLDSYRGGEEFKTAVLEECRTIFEALPEALHDDLGKAWFAWHAKLLEQAIAEGVLRGKSAPDSIKERLEDLAKQIAEGEF